MKGLIIYSSKTGNTKRMAEKIYEVLKDEHQMTIKDIRDAPEVEAFDFILLGAWIDRGTLETKTLKFLKTIKNKKLCNTWSNARLRTWKEGDKKLRESINRQGLLGTIHMPRSS